VSVPVSPEPNLAAFVAESPIHRPPIADAVRAFATSLEAGTRVLDAGAGQAPYRHLFAHCDYKTQDWPSSPHEDATGADVIADLRDLPLEDDSFDAAVCTEVLEHVETPGEAVAELARILRPGGRLLVTVPFVGELHEEPHDHFRYTSHGIRGLLDRGGFVVDEVRPLTGYFRTIAHLFRVSGTSVVSTTGPRNALARALAFALLVLSKLLERPARALDRIDQRRALPIGWSVLARLPDAPGGTANAGLHPGRSQQR
jgi:SAM-dependent methyltransferase